MREDRLSHWHALYFLLVSFLGSSLPAAKGMGTGAVAPVGVIAAVGAVAAGAAVGAVNESKIKDYRTSTDSPETQQVLLSRS